jgi:anti-sigma factor RsiW
MSECTKLEMKDLLPDLARGALAGPALAAVEAHLATCASCRAELELVRAAHTVLGATPSVDTARIAAAVGRSSSIRRDATAAVAQARRRRAWSVAAPSRRVWLAAASIVAAVGVSVIASNTTRSPVEPGPAPTVAQVEQPSTPVSTTPEPTPPAAPRSTGRAELVMAGGVSDLADADLESLLQVLDDVDTELDVEPAVLSPVLEGDV